MTNQSKALIQTFGIVFATVAVATAVAFVSTLLSKQVFVGIVMTFFIGVFSWLVYCWVLTDLETRDKFKSIVDKNSSKTA